MGVNAPNYEELKVITSNNFTLINFIRLLRKLINEKMNVREFLKIEIFLFVYIFFEYFFNVFFREFFLN